MTSDTELISRLRVLKKSYEEELLTKDEYDEYRLKELDDWSNNQEEERSFWRNLWDKTCRTGNSVLKSMIKPIVDLLILTKLISP
ncbi:hypothetical protein RhiirA5_407436 [Rhizophagus irregularis]|uniref:Uncharacterized protein n=3 Tax=Rhizophagus irregularis TaxID=588596 RepID=U9TSR0_RHIID|nr:hypothetical protein GLOIN_2v1768614 [Rhizophagus irregularis DAOM 181602=DAOM 197198]EXX77017.1 hypothetical protein RirG_027670 [Rhizophagus irregularis DAOM 197198w]PKC16082.1 hypothetical protein RhiirA5_407436 [Rhizophagus irregularis]PKK73387.1 hypothetical protein RhiirC2_847678 [Rhizophagus irregularis]PKY15041.1 hypothetical protein RhiirB3_427173 [Rhizophagus irregularis]PKY46836.1 hypothetical protein RhiirA4_461824 [Rhizophagus irregularis]|eukprot:XP_025183572.1 hypothetical protein GLOIN_2v1768614 [Rhizophagus irregularis DAOM 181602=DAOM 197198]